jgi:hypothetical protein
METAVFESKVQIEPYLRCLGVGRWSTAIAELCRPAFTFAKPHAQANGMSPPGNSRIGGLPELARTLAWPSRRAYTDWSRVIERMPDRTFLNVGLIDHHPLHFVAQIDLAEIARSEHLGRLLPTTGRLLFFWDAVCGPWAETANVCRVIHDTASAASLAPRPLPAQLTSHARDGFEPMIAPLPLIPVPIWSMPDPILMAELLTDASFASAIDDGEFDDFCELMVDNGARVLASGRTVLAHRLCGWPVPDQWDPRFTAAAAARGHRLVLGAIPDDLRKSCEREEHNWALLLQLDASALVPGIISH